MSSSTSFRSHASSLRLTWIALIGPMAWLLAFEAGYVLGMGCDRFLAITHAVFVVSAAASALAAWVAWRIGRHASESDSQTQHTRWLEGAAVALNVWFALTIVAMELPLFVVRPCVP